MIIVAINSEPLISVVMPVYNAELYVAEAIESILNQTHRNLELIIIDDCRHNKCKDVASTYSDPRVRYERGRGEGLVAARNYGVNLARGLYIANMDADDIAVPARLSVQLQYLKTNGCHICGSWMRRNGLGLHRNPVSDKDIKFSLLFFSSLANPTILGKADLFKENPYHISTAEDYDLWTRLAQRDVVFGNVPAPLVNYRTHPLQTSIIKVEGMIKDSEPIARRFAEYYLPRDQFAALEALSFGMSPRYSRPEAVELCELSLYVARERAVSQSVLVKIFALFFRKVVPMNPAVLFSYLRIARKASLPLWTAETFNVGVQSLLSLNKDNPLFGVLKKFGRS